MILSPPALEIPMAGLAQGTLCERVCAMQDQAFGELEKNSDKLQRGTSSSDSSQPAHLHQLLCSLQKQLLAYCHINSVTEVRGVLGSPPAWFRFQTRVWFLGDASCFSAELEQRGVAPQAPAAAAASRHRHLLTLGNADQREFLEREHPGEAPR